MHGAGMYVFDNFWHTHAHKYSACIENITILGSNRSIAVGTFRYDYYCVIWTIYQMKLHTCRFDDGLVRFLIRSFVMAFVQPFGLGGKVLTEKNDRKGQKIAPMANIVLCEQKSWRHFLRYIRREILHRYIYYIQIHTLINAKWAEADRPLLIFELNKLKHKGIVYSQNIDAKMEKNEIRFVDLQGGDSFLFSKLKSSSDKFGIFISKWLQRHFYPLKRIEVCANISISFDKVVNSQIQIIQSKLMWIVKYI